MATIDRELAGSPASLFSDDLLDSRSSTYESASASSTSTVPGPGALSGKAIKALGRITIRGIDHFVILRQLSVISHHFPLSDAKAASLKNVEEIYADTLEFSRQGLYREEVNRRALRLLFGQIGMGETKYLVKALLRWDKLELRLFLSELVIQLSPLWNPNLGKVLSSPLLSAYSTTCKAPVSVSPLLVFISKLIRTRGAVCRAVLDVGILDVVMLLRAHYNLNREDIVSELESSSDGKMENKRLLAETNAILLNIVAYPEHRSIVLNHPICVTWVTPHVVNPPMAPFTSREQALLLDYALDIPYHESSLYLVLNLPELAKLGCISQLDTAEIVDSLTFGMVYDQVLRIFLLRSSYDKKVALLTRFVKYMHENSQLNAFLPCSSPPGLSGYADTLRARYRLLFFLKLISAAAWGPSNRAALLDAGVVGLLVRVVQTEIPGSYSGVADALVRAGDLRADPAPLPPGRRSASGTAGRPRARTESHMPEVRDPEAVAYGAIPAVVCGADLARLLGGPLARTSRLVGLIAGAFSALFPEGDAHDAHLLRSTGQLDGLRE